MKFLKTLRFDGSDAKVFETAAGPEEWAVSGAFAFSGLAPGDLTGKHRQAFANGFLSIESFGRSTFVSVTGIGPEERDALTERLASHFVTRYGAPDAAAARPAAGEEIGFLTELCAGLPFGTVLTVRRSFDTTGEIREEFRKVDSAADCHHARVWDIVEEDG